MFVLVVEEEEPQPHRFHGRRPEGTTCRIGTGRTVPDGNGGTAWWSDIEEGEYVDFEDAEGDAKKNAAGRRRRRIGVGRNMVVGSSAFVWRMGNDGRLVRGEGVRRFVCISLCV